MVHSLPNMAHFITGASKAVFEYATVCPQQALTGQQDGDLAASSAHSPPGLCGRCPPLLLQLCQEDISSFLGQGSGQGICADPWEIKDLHVGTLFSQFWSPKSVSRDVHVSV